MGPIDARSIGGSKYAVMSRFRFSITLVLVRELTLYTLLRLTPYIVISVLDLSLQENHQR